MSSLSGTVTGVCFGESLWDLLPGGAVPGGAPMNVASHLSRLGVRTALITRVGFDDEGKKLIEHMAGTGIRDDYFQMDFIAPTGKVIATPLSLTEIEYEIARPAAWDMIDWDKQFPTLLRDSNFFVFGSLAARNQASRQTLYDLLEYSPFNVFDINLRRPHYDRSVLTHLLRHTRLLKLNLDELELLTGWFTDYPGERDRLKMIQDAFQIPQIALTRGAHGALYCDNGIVFDHPGYRVQAVDAIGSGDAFLAGLIARKFSGTPAADALAWANALGAFVAASKGPWPDYKMEDIDKLATITTEQ